MVENINVGDWVVDYSGDYGQVVDVEMGAEPLDYDLIRCSNWRFFKSSHALATWREKISFVFKTESQAKVIADILAMQHEEERYKEI